MKYINLDLRDIKEIRESKINSVEQVKGMILEIKDKKISNNFSLKELKLEDINKKTKYISFIGRVCDKLENKNIGDYIDVICEINENQAENGRVYKNLKAFEIKDLDNENEKSKMDKIKNEDEFVRWNL